MLNEYNKKRQEDQMNISNKYLIIFVLAALFLFAGVSLVLATDNNTIYACVKNNGGKPVQIANTPITCDKSSETLLSWGIEGPQGDPGYLDIYTNESPCTSFLPGVTHEKNVACDPLDEVLSGGYEIRDVDVDNPPSTLPVDVLFKCVDLNWSKPDGDNGWRVQVKNNCESGLAWMKVYVRCADTTP